MLLSLLLSCTVCVLLLYLYYLARLCTSHAEFLSYLFMWILFVVVAPFHLSRYSWRVSGQAMLCCHLYNKMTVRHILKLLCMLVATTRMTALFPANISHIVRAQARGIKYV